MHPKIPFQAMQTNQAEAQPRIIVSTIFLFLLLHLLSLFPLSFLFHPPFPLLFRLGPSHYFLHSPSLF